MQTDLFSNRHIGINSDDTLQSMLKEVGVNSLEELIKQIIPENIIRKELALDTAMSENDFLAHMRLLSDKNEVYKTYIGLGYNASVTPSVIKRNIFENPGWYTAYTPYQAEISQGRLEAILNYQTMIMELTGMEIANASLLDESTAASEAMFMSYQLRNRNQKEAGVSKFLVSDQVLPQTIAILKTKASAQGINLIIGDAEKTKIDKDFFGVLLQYPAKNGRVAHYQSIITQAKEFSAKIIFAADIMSLVLLTPPSELGADIVVGTTQRFGIPLGYGGPHAAFFATKEEYKRFIPGRIIGLSKDLDGKPALRMALQTREQHIKRDKATSNVCTAQILLAIMASMYAVYHGPKGLKYIATKIHNITASIKEALQKMKVEVVSDDFFDTLIVKASKEKLEPFTQQHKVNFYYPDDDTVSISINETTNLDDVQEIVDIFSFYLEKATSIPIVFSEELSLNPVLLRNDEFLTQKVFNTYHSETKLMRYIKKLERKDLSLNHSMIALGSCTMKLNAASQMLPLSHDKWGSIHPFVPKEQAAGYDYVLHKLEQQLSEVTGFAATSLQPNSGAQGEYAGLITIKSYLKSIGQGHRNICLIPASAHGTNPASAVISGMKVLVVKSTEQGNIDVDDLKEKAETHKDNLAAIMITYPSTHGVYETSIKDITAIVHQYGGQVYMDGANMNAQVAYTSPAKIGADVCHLNLHKTFAIPHGGGGPGVGPICVAKHLEPFLPTHPIVARSNNEATENVISSAPWGSALVCLISYGYITMLGKDGLKKSTEIAILNANYIKSRLEKHFKILYTGNSGRVAHEMIVDFREFKPTVEVTHIAKRLMDYGFHAPTISFPVAGTVMIEPTESEDKNELDRFCNALIKIKNEIATQPELLLNAPHTLEMSTADTWNFPYSRTEAVYPMKHLKENKFWASVRRIDEAYGDRNLICSCTPLEDYEN